MRRSISFVAILSILSMFFFLGCEILAGPETSPRGWSTTTPEQAPNPDGTVDPLTGKSTTGLTCRVEGSSVSPAYNPNAGVNHPPNTVEICQVRVVGPDGTVTIEEEERTPETNTFGNLDGNQYDLAVDDAFVGQTIVVLHLYNREGFDFVLPNSALAEKGFTIKKWSGEATPPVNELAEALAGASQLWVISSKESVLEQAHIDLIRDFFNEGHGVYIWGDNEPYFADANKVAQALLGVTMTGNTEGDQVVGISSGAGQPGVLAGHLLSTGLEFLYEGITIATIGTHPDLKPLIYGSDRNVVTAYYDTDGKRLILDGGFTRLYNKWDTAGTARYVKNAAAWLTNVERFGDAVIADHLRGN